MKINSCLWFDGRALEAAEFYLSVFPGSEILEIKRYPDGTPGLSGQVLTVLFRMAGQEFIALNGGPMFRFTEAISFSVDVKNQEELDYYWSRLTEDGEESHCGWLKDKFGLSWQVVPAELGDRLYHPDPYKAKRAMEALLKMKKIEIETLKKAVNYSEADLSSGNTLSR